MRRKTPSVEPMVREAFGLLMELRGRPEAPRLLKQALAFLQMLTQDGATSKIPVVFSVQIVSLRKS